MVTAVDEETVEHEPQNNEQTLEIFLESYFTPGKREQG